MDTTWLKEVCSKEDQRPYLSLPMRFDRDGRSYTVASDGMKMVELPGGEATLSVPDERLMVGLRKYLAPTPESALRFDFEDLRTFIRRETKGTSSRLPVFVYVAGALFNARLFLPMVRHLPPTKDARWYRLSPPPHFPSGPGCVDGGDWRFLVMPMLDRGDKTGIPRFEIEGAEAKAA